VRVKLAPDCGAGVVRLDMTAVPKAKSPDPGVTVVTLRRAPGFPPVPSTVAVAVPAFTLNEENVQPEDQSQQSEMTAA
jgi:hypothetical protein